MRHVIVGTAGHIDHGKSALVRALTGTDPDRLKEEKARGITIDLGFAHLESPGVSLGFVDVPGHERFVKNMLAGATGIDLVVLVVAADESVMPQTREHFDICRLLRVRAGLVALTKCDLVDADTLELATLEVRELVAGSFMQGAPIVPVSAKTGEGLEALRQVLVDLAARAPSQASDGVARLPIDRVFSVKGFGTVVTGTLVSGRVSVDDELVALPLERTVKVRGLQVHGEAVTRAQTAQRVAVNLAGIDVGELERGAVLAAPGSYRPTRRIDAVVEVLPGARALRHGARMRFHQGTSEHLGRLAAPAAEVLAGGREVVRIRLERETVVTRGDRFILRAYSPPVTVAGGVVLDPHPPRGPIRTPAGRARLSALDPGPAGDPLSVDSSLRAGRQMVNERGSEGLERTALVARAGLSPEMASRLEARLAEEGGAVSIGAFLVAPEAIAQAEAHLLALLAEHHRSQPLSEGLAREELRTRVLPRAPAIVFEHVINDLVARQKVVARDRVALTTHRLTLSDADQRALDGVERAYRQGGLKPPDPSSLATSLGVGAAEVERALTLLLRRKTLVRLDTLLFHEEALARLKDEVRALKGAADPAHIDVATFKERYGVSRKFAIPLLEFLDRERVTRRVGETRVVL